MKHYVKGLSVSKSDRGDYFNAYMAYTYTAKYTCAPLTASRICDTVFRIFSLVDISECETVEQAFNTLVDSTAYPSSNPDLAEQIIALFQSNPLTHTPLRYDVNTRAYADYSLLNGIKECAKDYLMTLGAWGLTGAERDYDKAYSESIKRAWGFPKLFEE